MSRAATIVFASLAGSAVTFAIGYGILRLLGYSPLSSINEALQDINEAPPLPPEPEPGADEAPPIPEVALLLSDLPEWKPTAELEEAVFTTIEAQAKDGVTESSLPAPLDRYRPEYGPKVVYWADVAFFTHFQIPWSRLNPDNTTHASWINGYLDILSKQAELAGVDLNGLAEALKGSPVYGLGKLATPEQLKRLSPDYVPPAKSDVHDEPQDEAPGEEPGEEPGEKPGEEPGEEPEEDPGEEPPKPNMPQAPGVITLWLDDIAQAS